MCSDRIRSTVTLNPVLSAVNGDNGDMAGGEEGREDGVLRIREVLGEVSVDLPIIPFGVVVPLSLNGLGRRASEAALSRRLVVPRAFTDPDRAEQTTATLC
jgi:hypothetical protein